MGNKIIIKKFEDESILIVEDNFWWWDTNNLWYFATDTALTTAHPTASNWNYAVVWSTDTIWIWDSDTNTWKNSWLQSTILEAPIDWKIYWRKDWAWIEAITLQSTWNLLNSATAKTTPVDADMIWLMDSAWSNILKKLSWVNIKAALKTYFDTLYNPSWVIKRTSFSRAVNLSWTQVINHSLWRIPTEINFSFSVVDSLNNTYLIWNWWWNLTNNECVILDINGYWPKINNASIFLSWDPWMSWWIRWAITAWDATTFTITWTSIWSTSSTMPWYVIAWIYW